MTREEYEFVRSRATLVRDFGMGAFGGALLKHEGQTLDRINCTGVTANMGTITNFR